MPAITCGCPVGAAKLYARAYGFMGQRGGWIRRLSDNKPMAHGWAEFARLCIRRRWIVVSQSPGGLATYIVTTPGNTEVTEVQ